MMGRSFMAIIPLTLVPCDELGITSTLCHETRKRRINWQKKKDSRLLPSRNKKRQKTIGCISSKSMSADTAGVFPIMDIQVLTATRPYIGCTFNNTTVRSSSARA
ncbi:hypothetical protein F4808DRAFT_267840 [Astrocystis sublimbata]|nr:hypothetical protein F4808DRAFT_267840 [Astrocystis sublimbata]